MLNSTEVYVVFVLKHVNQLRITSTMEKTIRVRRLKMVIYL